MGEITAVLYIMVFLAAGVLAAKKAVPDGGYSLWLPLGCGFGISLLAALPAAAALVLGFTLPAALAALFLVLIFLLFLARIGRAGSPRPKCRDWLPLAACCLPLFAVTCYLLHTHVLHLVDGAYHTGQSCYGDMAMHLGFIKNMAVTGDFPPLYPLLGGEHRFGYPFLCESVSAVLLLLGCSLRTAYLLPMLAAFLSVYGMVWHFARRVLGSAAKASLAFWLFLMGSGFGFVYFLGSTESFKSIFTGFYTTPTNYVEKNILWVNPIVDLLIPQRATLFGWSVLFPALYLLWRFCFESERRLWLPLALLVLPLPLLHTHSALALVLLCLVCGIYTLLHRPLTALTPWGFLALLCGVVWLAEMWNTVFAQSLDGQNMLRLHFNWINNSGEDGLKDNYFWFYIKNIGLVYLLLIPAFLHAKPRQRWLYGGGVLIWALAECVVFQPNLYDNNKLLFIWHLLGCLLVANLLVDCAAKLPCALSIPLLAGCVFAATFGSLLTMGREAVSDYRQWSAEDIALSAYIEENTPADALFLTSDSHLTPVFSLSGRRILCGSGSFVYYHGMEYSNEYAAMRALYETPEEGTLSAWGIDYVLFDSYVYGRFKADENWYSSRYPLIYGNPSCRLYQIT